MPGEVGSDNPGRINEQSAKKALEQPTTRRNLLKVTAGFLAGRAIPKAIKTFGSGVVLEEAIRRNIPGQDQIETKVATPESAVSSQPPETPNKSENMKSEEDRKNLVYEKVQEQVTTRDKAVNSAYQKVCSEYSFSPQSPFTTSQASHPLWYINNPDALHSDIVNEEEFLPWLQGVVPEKPTNQHKTEILFNHDDPPQLPLGALAQQTFETIVLKDRQRVKKIILGGANITDKNAGEVVWSVYDAYDLLPENKETLCALVHEITHAAVPDLHKIFVNDETKFILGTESGSYPDLLRFETMWMENFTKNFDFFQERFFNAKGDGTLGFIRENGPNGMIKSMDEFIAMLCTDYVLPNDNSMHPDEWPDDIKKAVDITWNFIRYGNKSNLQPISHNEIDNIHERLLGYYTQYKTIRKQEDQ